MINSTFTLRNWRVGGDRQQKTLKGTVTEPGTASKTLFSFSLHIVINKGSACHNSLKNGSELKVGTNNT